MTARGVAGRTIRQKKLSTKQNIAVIREDEFEDTYEDEASRNIPRLETGVDKAEETVSIPHPSSPNVVLIASLINHVT
jgi:enhancer of polycomb-like protein